MDKNYAPLKLENQICFPLYAVSKEVIKKYKPYLDPLGLTYTQYITMMVMWEKETINVKELGEALYLDSGTLTPLLKKLEAKGFITRTRSREDERTLCVELTANGKELRDKLLPIPEQIASCIPLNHDEALQLYTLLHKLLNKLENS
ncbi:MarR family winged helix-turn-helix transcriptional regulator [Alloiococcus sp. CFN-8]|uniref:MarR family winged helix-turn-helix transcriptional regulator n=1 Tax=Alloiococcus sp. CFN-8 TaxID=3416081 RepID=UPI003CEECADE